MKRVTIDNFDGGVVNKANPETQPDNTLTVAENYEYRDRQGLKKRFGNEQFPFDKIPNVTNIKKFDVWYPNRTLSNMTDDKLFVIHVGEQEQQRNEDLIEIYLPSQLYDVRNNLSGNYIMMNDIDLKDYTSGTGWHHIAENGNPFTGTFNGNGYKITNLVVKKNGTEGYGSLFGTTREATIENLFILRGYVEGTQNVGMLIGECSYGTTLNNIRVSGDIACDGNSIVGGIAGEAYDSTWTNCVAEVYITADSVAGGLLGYSFGVTMNNCYTNYTIATTYNGENKFGGAVGVCVNAEENDTVFNNCYAVGNIEGHIIGGFIGSSEKTDPFAAKEVKINNCYAAAILTETNVTPKFGGFIAQDDDSITTATKCYFDSTTSDTTTGIYGTAKTTAEMLKQATYVDWDFDGIWTIIEDVSYPTLR